MKPIAALARILAITLLSGGAGSGAIAQGTSAEASRWQRESQAVTIVRDNWGIAHVYGTTDADVVFGATYAQAEDDFTRIEHNYLIALGRLAEAEGQTAIYADLRERLFMQPAQLKKSYAASPPWLQKLMTAWADGLNFFLLRHPNTHPKVLMHFDPWMALSFTEGSIGGDIESVDLAQLESFYGKSADAKTSGTLATPGAAVSPRLLVAFEGSNEAPPGGSNGFAIAPSLSASGHALLWINPHTSFYFRSELQMVSKQGLNVYGAITWGQFFVYQGFNPYNGWMHTSYGGDAIDEYAEKVAKKGMAFYYEYGTGLRKLEVSHIRVPYKQGENMADRDFTVYHSHHGPIVRAQDGRWIAVKLLQDPVHALMQSYLRTKTRDYASFRSIQDMRTDTSNNTVYADADGTIAYFHGNFIPRRDPRFDFTHPVDGSDPRTEWQGAHALADTITLLNPENGWIMNTNNWPFSAAGQFSPKREDFPRYMWTRGENPRGIHATEMLQNMQHVTLDGLIAAAYDGHLTAFEVLLPPLLQAYDNLAPNDPLWSRLREPIAVLRQWNRRTSAASVATSVAIFWGNTLIDMKGVASKAAELPVYDYLIENLSDEERLNALAAAVDNLQHTFGHWQIPWGDINRFQRTTDDVVQPFDDAKSSLPVGFAPAQWGALASFDSAKPRSTRKIYGSVGNSFVAAVEFSSPIRAKAIMSGGASGDPSSVHFVDQAMRFSQGQFRDVLFTADDVSAHAERRYHPGY